MSYKPHIFLDADATMTPEEGFDFVLYGQLDNHSEVDFEIIGQAEYSTENTDEPTDIEYNSGFVPRGGGGELYTITGHLTDIDSGSPMNYAGVRITDLNSGTELITVETDNEGEYEAFGIPGGTFVEVRPLATRNLFHPNFSNLVVDSDEVVDFTYEADDEKKRLSGYITGDVIEGVTITLFNAVSGSRHTSVVSDDTGYYVYSDIDANDELTIVPTIAGHTFEPPEVTKFFITNQAQDFVATASPNNHTLSGTISEDSSPLEGVTVILQGLPGPIPLGTDTTDSAGQYSFQVTDGTLVKFWPSLTDYQFTPVNAELTIKSDTVQDFTGAVISETDWQFTHGGNAEEIGWAMVVDSIGMQYLGGQISGGGESSMSAYIEKRNKWGYISWAKRLSVSGDFAACWINDLAYNQDEGEILGAGYIYPGGGNPPQAWVFRMSHSGEMLQSRSGPGTDVNAIGTGIALLPDGDYYVTGPASDFEIPSTGQDVLAMKFDGTTHEPEWVELLEGDEYEAVGPCGIDGDGNLVVAGIYDSGPPTDDDFMIAKFLPDGTLKWAGAWDVMFDNTALTGMCVGPSNEVYLVGGRQGLPIILRVSDSTTNGSLDWARTWDYTGSAVQSSYFEDCAYNIADSTIYVCGRRRDDTNTNSHGLLLEFDATALNVLNHTSWMNQAAEHGTQFKRLWYDQAGLIYFTGVSVDYNGFWWKAEGTLNTAPPMSTRSYSGAVEVLTPTFTDVAVTVSDYYETLNFGGGGGDALSGRCTDFPTY